MVLNVFKDFASSEHNEVDNYEVHNKYVFSGICSSKNI